MTEMTETTTFPGLPTPLSAVPASDAISPNEVVCGAGKPLLYHSAAELFPLMAVPAFDALVADIRSSGQREAIVLHPDGSILDGRNRYRACEIIGIEPKTVPWEGEPGTELAYVMSVNLHRRHLNVGQRAMIAAKMATLSQGIRQTGNFSGVPTQAEAAAAFHISDVSLRQAKAVIESGNTELIGAVESGAVTVSKAATLVRQRAPQRRGSRPETALRKFDEALKTLTRLPPAGDVVAGAVTRVARQLIATKIAEARVRLAEIEAVLLRVSRDA